MEVIKPLSEAVQSMVRSGFIISCLTTVVEELIYNSLDAGATKVSVLVSVNNGYVKVEDNGFGIGRDGLVMLGERYATSKPQHFHEKDADSKGSFGFRGEVLCSIADISLVEIVTRVQGRPNGYRKVMKGRKCLCLSIDNDRQDVGTTVIVRDLFYNQPVRRRQMQCRAKKVLHSVKKCAVRIALVQPKVSFKVIDMESEGELLCTRSCPSPLSLLWSNFGIEASSLHELSFAEGSFKLTGYISALSSSFSSKAIQYIYVNSRFVVKGPIHKVLNRLAEMFHDQLRGDRGEKRGQPHAGPLYCLNLTCPRYSYDLNLEFSRASVEFKDWAPLLVFIEKSVTSLWSEEMRRGISHNHEAGLIRKDRIEKLVGKDSSAEKEWLLKTCEMPSKRRRIQNSDNQHACTKDSLEIKVQDCNKMPARKNTFKERINSESIGVKFRDSQTEEFPCQIDFHGVGDGSLSNYIFNVTDDIGNGLLELDKELVNDITIVEKEANYANKRLSSSRWKDEVILGCQYAGSHELGSIPSFEFMPENDRNRADYQRELRLQSYSWENPLPTPLSCDEESQFQIENRKAKRTCSNSWENGDADSLSQDFENYQRAQSSHDVANTWPLPDSNIRSHTRKDRDIDHRVCGNSLPSCGGVFDREYPVESLRKRGRELFPCSPTNLDQHSAITYPFLYQKDRDFDKFIQNEGFVMRSGVRDADGFEQSYYEKEEFYRDSLSDSFGNKNFTSTSCLSENAGLETGIWEFSPHEDNVDEISSVMMGDPLFDDIYLPSMDKRRGDSSVCWSPSISSKRGIQMDLLKGEEFGQDNITRERSRSIYDSPDGLLTAKCDSVSTNETFSPVLDFQSNLSSYKSPVSCFPSVSAGKGPSLGSQRSQALELKNSSLESGNLVRSRRSSSAPPFYRGKRRFLSIQSSLISTTEKTPQVCAVSERVESKNLPRPALSFSVNHQHNGMSVKEDSLFFVEQDSLSKSPPRRALSASVNHHHDVMRVKEDSLFCVDGISRQEARNTSNIASVSAWSLDGNTETAFFSSGCLKEVQDLENSQTKWREGCPDARLKEIANYLRAGDRLNRLQDENEILDIQSCMLDLAGDSLVPKYIDRSGLENAKVLPQIDNKFIPVVASGTLAVIDQHAADERIRLEEMRRKVLSGEMKSTSYLEKEKDLVLPEMAYQLLCNYAEHIKHWGWICNIFSQDSGSFTKNLNLLNDRASHLTLIAVPCILGVKLSDADLVEYLKQLADTDGSSTIPPSVVRILNYKACRGAIMFGDKLLPSECSLIVDELKQTSLCFQCAHGRPTTVPLVNLKALHKGILQLGSWHDRLNNNAWHGLCRKDITLDRAKHRLDVAGGCQ